MSCFQKDSIVITSGVSGEILKACILSVLVSIKTNLDHGEVGNSIVSADLGVKAVGTVNDGNSSNFIPAGNKSGKFSVVRSKCSAMTAP